MKRIIAAVSFAVLAVPAFAAEVSAPFEQNQLDRVLPNIIESQHDDAAAAGSSAATGVWAQDYNFVAPAQ